MEIEEKESNAAEVSAETSANGSQTDKLFTQSDVDRIIKERLKRQKVKAEEDTAAEYQQREDALTKRENDIKIRETRLQCKEYLSEKGYPSEIMDIISVDDFATFKEKAEKVMRISSASKHRTAPIASLSETAPGTTGGGFDKSVKHKPKAIY